MQALEGVHLQVFQVLRSNWQEVLKRTDVRGPFYKQCTDLPQDLSLQKQIMATQSFRGEKEIDANFTTLRTRCDRLAPPPPPFPPTGTAHSAGTCMAPNMLLRTPYSNTPIANKVATCCCALH